MHLATGALALWDCVRTDGRAEKKWRHNQTKIFRIHGFPKFSLFYVKDETVLDL